MKEKQSVNELIETLKEIDGLLRYKKGHVEKIQEEEKRIDFLKKQLRHKEEELSESKEKLLSKKSELVHQENELERLQQINEKLQEKESQIKDQRELDSFEKEKIENTHALSLKEEDVFHLLEEVENLTQNSKEINTFLNGSKSGLEEIQKESQEKQNKEKTEITHCEKRIHLMLETLPQEMKLISHQLLQKFSLGPITSKIKTDTCGICRFRQTQITIQNINSAKTIENCLQCKRFLIP